jgi:hypothetical protein
LEDLSTTGHTTSEGLKIEAKITGIYPDACEPTLRLQFDFVSASDQQYTILPFMCDLFLNTGPFERLYIGKASIYNEGSSSGYLQELRIVPPRGTCTLHSLLELGFTKVNKIDETRKDARKKDVHFTIRIYGWVKTEKEEIKTVGTEIENVVVAESEWVDWLKKWGKEVRLIQLSGVTLKRFDELKRNWKADDAELVALMTDKLTDTAANKEPEFVCTLPDKRTIEDRFRDILARASDVDEVLVAGWTDQTLEREIKKLSENGVGIRVILGAGDTKQASRPVQDAVSRLRRQGIQIKSNDWMHARLLISGDREAVISSADLKADSLVRNREAGIYSTNPTVVREASDFFERIWEEAVPSGKE